YLAAVAAAQRIGQGYFQNVFVLSANAPFAPRNGGYLHAAVAASVVVRACRELVGYRPVKRALAEGVAVQIEFYNIGIGACVNIVHRAICLKRSAFGAVAAR